MAPEGKRRQPPRFEAKWPVTIQTTGDLIEGETRDISTIGVSIRCQQPLQPHKILRIFITPPEHPTIVVSGKPDWSTAHGPDEISTGATDSCFIEVPSHDRQLLGEVIGKHFERKIGRTDHRK